MLKPRGRGLTDVSNTLAALDYRVSLERKALMGHLVHQAQRFVFKLQQ